MESLTRIMFVFLAALSAYFAVETSDIESGIKPESGRSGRTYDKHFKYPKVNHGDFGGDKGDEDDDYKYGQPALDFNDFKGNVPYNYPPFGANYKGYPFYPSFKGAFKFPGAVGQPDSSSNQLAVLSKPQDKDDKGGFLSNLMSDPLAAAALVPLSVMFASLVPVMMNNLMGGAPSGQQVVTTTASKKKEGRNLEDVSDRFERMMAQYYRDVSENDCFEKAICKSVTKQAQGAGPDEIRRAFGLLSSLRRYDWIKNLEVKDILENIKEGNCDNLCLNRRSGFKNHK